MKTKTTLAALLLAAVMVTPSYGSESLSRIEKEGEKRKAFGVAAIEKGVNLIDDKVEYHLETITVSPSDGLPDPVGLFPVTDWLYGKKIYEAEVDADLPEELEKLFNPGPHTRVIRVQFFVEEDEITVVSVGVASQNKKLWGTFRSLYVGNKRHDELRAVLTDYVVNAYRFVEHVRINNYAKFGRQFPDWTDKNIKSKVKRFAPKMVSEVEAELKAKKVDLLSVNEALQELNTTPEDYWIDNVVVTWHYFANGGPY